MDDYRRALALYDYTVGLRRHFHTWPECMPEEQVHTMERIERELDAMSVPHERVPGGGIFGFIGGSRPGRTLLMRADMDALPIREDPENLAGPRTCLSRVEGVMHACGHDAHTAMLLTEARILKETEAELPGRILLMFEEGEEGGGNIMKLCRALDREDLRPDGAYACHTLWSLPTGVIGITEGVSMCGLYHFAIHIHGLTGHGSRPDQGHNVIDCFTQIYGALQNVRMTAIDPAHRLTYSICTVHAGERHNVLPDSLRAAGTVRFDHVESGVRFMEKLRQIGAACGAMCECRVEIEQLEVHHPVSMEGNCRSLLRSAVTAELGPEHVVTAPMWMASESFSHITDMIPSAFAFVGIRNEAKGSGAGHHTSKFDIDEEAMPWGVAAAVAYARAFLREPPDTSGFRPMAESMADYLKLVGE